MELKEALKDLVSTNGTGVFKSSIFLNLLSDYNAFAEYPSSKNILRNIISEGYVDKLIHLSENHLDVANLPHTYLVELVEKLGFRQDVTYEVLNAILFSLNLDEIVFNKPQDNVIRPIPQKGSETVPAVTGKHLTFKGIEINGSVEAFANILQSQGFSHVTTSDQNSIVLQGTYAGMNNCNLIICYGQYIHQVRKIAIFSEEYKSWYPLHSKYTEMKNLFSQKYGTPESYEFFSSPYEEGDGYEMTALSVEKATFSSYFWLPLGCISISITVSGGILISYEDKLNTEMNSTAEKQAVLTEI
jgi:hypothetical protein